MLGNSRTLYIFGDICEEMAEEFIGDLAELIKEDKDASIDVAICTDGGCLYSMFAMHDVIRNSPTPIRTIGVGKVMSAGVVLLACARKRLLFPNASVMIHEALTEPKEAGTAYFINQIAHTQELDKQLYSLYAEYTGQTYKDICSLLDKESGLYFTAKGAINYGFADEIIEFPKRERAKRKTKRTSTKK